MDLTVEGTGLLGRLQSGADTMTEHLAALVGAESPSSDLSLLRRCAEVLSSIGESVLGRPAAQVEVDGVPHLRWDLNRVDGGEGVLLVGHYDTVWPAGTLDRWPFRTDGQGRATGPGAFDMKAGIVQMLHAAATVLDRHPAAPVTLLVTADEETGSFTSRQLIEAAAAGATAALVLEPSAGGALKTARKGTSMYEVEVVGRSAHAGLEPEKGINAAVELAHQILAVAGLGHPDAGTTVTPTVLSGGTTTNTVPASALLHVDGRATSRAEQERVDRAVRELAPVLDGAELRIHGGINRPPLDAASSAALMDRARRVASALGIPAPAGVAVGGGSDGNFTAGVGVPTLDGLGAVGDGAHAEGEYVQLDQMPVRAALVAGLILDLTAGR